MLDVERKKLGMNMFRWILSHHILSSCCSA